MKIPISRLKVIAFDLDDTLYPERSFVLSGFNAVASWAHQEYGIPHAQGFAELRELFEFGLRGVTFDRWAAAHGLDAATVVPEMVEIYRSHKPKIKLYEDTLPCLEAVMNRCRLALITEGFGKVQAGKMEALGLRNYFEFIHIGDEHSRETWKPNPYPFEKMLEGMSVSGSQAAYLGDNPAKDFRGANQLNMLTVRVRRQDGLHAHIEPGEVDSSPKFEVSDLRQFTIAIRDE